MGLDENGFPTDTLGCPWCHELMSPTGSGVTDGGAYDHWRCAKCEEILERDF